MQVCNVDPNIYTPNLKQNPTEPYNLKGLLEDKMKVAIKYFESNFCSKEGSQVRKKTGGTYVNKKRDFKTPY